MVKSIVAGATLMTLAAACWLAAERRSHDAKVGAVLPASTARHISSVPPPPLSLSRTPAIAHRAPTTSVRDVPAARPPRNPCAGLHDRTVLVSLSAQHLWLCDGRTVDADFALTTGRHAHGDRTPTGTYDVQARTRDTTLDPSTGSTYHVKYWLPFKWGIYGFHDASWQTIPFGSQRYRTDGSDGCVHMRESDIKRMFGWVHLGTPVRIRA